MFRDENGKLSMTRFVLFVTIVVFAIVSIVDTFSAIEVEQTVYQIIQMALAFGLGGQTVRTSIKNSKTETVINGNTTS